MARGHSVRPRTPGVRDVLGTGLGPASAFRREALILKIPLLLTSLLLLFVVCQYRYHSHEHEQVNEILVLAKTGTTVPNET